MIEKKEEINYQTLSDEVFVELNKIRKDPRCYIEHLKKMKLYFKGKEYRNPKLNYFIQTEEGVDAVDEAIDFLQNKAFKKGELERDENLDKSAMELANFIGPKGLTGPGQDNPEI